MGRWVANATANIGARVESEPSINPVMAGCTRCNRNDCVATAVETAIVFTSSRRPGHIRVGREQRFDDMKSFARYLRRGIPDSARCPLLLSGVRVSCWRVVECGAGRGDGDEPEGDRGRVTTRRPGPAADGAA
jgi:hypothetical protein